MKPFDLKLAAAGHPIQTRSGKIARFVAHMPDVAYANNRVVVVVDRDVYHVSEVGTCHSGRESHCDLFMVPVKHKRWINLYDESSCHYLTREEADMKAREDRLACIEVTFTEGEGL